VPISTYTYKEFLKTALRLRVALPLLGKMPLNIMFILFFLVLGLANPAFYFLGIAFEMVYLFFIANLPGVKKVIEGQLLLQQKQKQGDQTQRLAASLEPVARERFVKLQNVCRSMLDSFDFNQNGVVGKDELKSGGLNQLLGMFLRLLSSQKRVMAILKETNPSSIRDDIRKIEKQLEQLESDSPMARSLRGTLEIQNRRLVNLEKAQESSKVIETELDRIEKQITLMREEMAVTSDVSLFSSRLDGVVDSLQGTTRWMTENADLFGSFEQVDFAENILDNNMPEPTKTKQRSRSDA